MRFNLPTVERPRARMSSVMFEAWKSPLVPTAFRYVLNVLPPSLGTTFSWTPPVEYSADAPPVVSVTS